MTGEISTLILTIDLDCHLCYKKIKKVLCKLQGKEHIKKIAYDEKEQTVEISGPFDPIKLKNKLCCKACKVIKGIKIKKKKKSDENKKAGPDKGDNKLESTDTGNKKPEPVYLPIWSVGFIAPTIPVCCYLPYYVGYNDSCRCCSCGCLAGWPRPQPAVSKPVIYQFSCDCEEVPSPCRIM